ncbi:hypothetical protein [Runella limosa]|uniref:hypothetical protein n=1 Tax=Runella limosa TaxID=370978 RepID=UPI00048DE158|nr:hypothetical protein [Runella limosa]
MKKKLLYFLLLLLAAENSMSQIIPTFEPKVFKIPGGHRGRFTTNLNINEGDYLYIEALGEVRVGYFFVSYVPADGFQENPDPHALDKFDKPNFRDFPHGTLMCWIDNWVHPCTKVFAQHTTWYQRMSMKEDWFLGADLSDLKGWIFLAPKSGVLEFEINDLQPENNSGFFSVSVIKMTKSQHLNRNYYNRCPKVAPQSKGMFGDYIDNKGSVWDKDFDVVSKMYHGGQLTFRSERGFQCTYDHVTKILTNPPTTMGTFDYGYGLKQGMKRHFILDVFPHELYKGLTYTETKNTY